MHIVNEITPRRAQPTLPNLRTRVIRQLSDGTAVGLAADLRRDFEDTPLFGNIKPMASAGNPAKWLANQITQLGRHLAFDERPIILPSPLTALAHSQTAKTCVDAADALHLCQQEICLEFKDEAFAGESYDSTSRLTRLKSAGFRVGADISRSFNSQFTETDFLLLDTLKVSVSALHQDNKLRETIEVAAQMGTMVIATDAKWRDAEMLAYHGVYCAIEPKADA